MFLVLVGDGLPQLGDGLSEPPLRLRHPHRLGPDPLKELVLQIRMPLPQDHAMDAGLGSEATPVGLRHLPVTRRRGWWSPVEVLAEACARAEDFVGGDGGGTTSARRFPSHTASEIRARPDSPRDAVSTRDYTRTRPTAGREPSPAPIHLGRGPVLMYLLPLPT
ncbi:hypothetical protein GCM10010211_76540 [Streptomyces albospinus]|uniref:Uncharacterized protein n=1 Tax=Streptomyces albospinus TaxID=285515 RepID=A0ABQ2VML0_9ACTN|nr:hypothetical protein GCM10010211_76540 [Streptomyces albospinus]